MKEMETKVYCVTLKDRQDNKHEVFAYGMDEISSEIPDVKIGSIVHKFAKLGVAEKDMRRPVGRIDLLIGHRLGSGWL